MRLSEGPSRNREHRSRRDGSDYKTVAAVVAGPCQNRFTSGKPTDFLLLD